jgi:hypothetical protein
VEVHLVRLPGGLIFLADAPTHPALRALRREERLDDVVAGHGGDTARLGALARWTAALFPTGDPTRNYPPWDARTTLDRIRRGDGEGWCAQYAFVFAQAAQSLGYWTRTLDLADGSLTSSHVIAEAWLPTEERWAAFDPSRGAAFVDGSGAPRNALEIHRGAETFLLSEKERTPLPRDQRSLFVNLRVHLRNNFNSVPVFLRVLRDTHGTSRFHFEPFDLQWVDDRTTTRRSRSAETSEETAFNFPIDETSQGIRRRLLGHFTEAVRDLSVGQWVRLRTPRSVLESALRRELPEPDEYHPLSSR